MLSKVIIILLLLWNVCNGMIDLAITSAPTSSWYSITSDSTGQFLAALSQNGGIYVSNNYGSTWTNTLGLVHYSSSYGFKIVSDTTGQYLAAATVGTSVYTSTNYGSTWTLSSSPNALSMTSDSTGQFLAAVVDNGGIFTSNDYGSTWTATSAPSAHWKDITSDSTGKYLAATSSDVACPVHTSSDYGHSWTPRSRNFRYIASDSTGQFLYGEQANGRFWRSLDYGANWAMVAALPSSTWSGIAVRSAGKHVYAAAYNPGAIYESDDYGSTWTQISTLNVHWIGIATDATGRYIAAAVNAGKLYTAYVSPPTVIPTAYVSPPTVIPTLLPTNQAVTLSVVKPNKPPIGELYDRAKFPTAPLARQKQAELAKRPQLADSNSTRSSGERSMTKTNKQIEL
jgi:photosystem II stability/assembly factor-like uncharacterized protein